MSGVNILKNKKLWFALSAIIIIAGLVCSVAIGVNDVEFTGAERRTAALGEEFDAANADAVAELAAQTAGAGVSARVLSGYTTTGSALELTLKNGAQPDLDAVKAAVNAAYPDAAIDSFSSSKLAPSKSLSSVLVAFGCFALLWAVGWLASIFSVGLKDSVVPLLAVVHDTLITMSAFVLLRAGDIKTLIACGLLAGALSLYFNTVKAIETNSLLGAKKDREQAVCASTELLGARNVTYVVFAALLSAGIAIASAVMSGGAAIRFAALLFVALVAGVYSSECLAPCVWSMKKQ